MCGRPETISTRAAMRLVIWQLTDSPRRHGAFQVSGSESELFILVETPYATQFTPDGRLIYALFASGAIAQYDIE